MTELPNKWRKSEKSLRAVQLVFEFGKAVSENIRREANTKGISSSDQIRQIIGLPTKKTKRPRLSVSLSEEDYELLGRRYHLPSEDRAAIRQAIIDEVVAYHQPDSEKGTQ